MKKLLIFLVLVGLAQQVQPSFDASVSHAPVPDYEAEVYAKMKARAAEVSDDGDAIPIAPYEEEILEKMARNDRRVADQNLNNAEIALRANNLEMARCRLNFAREFFEDDGVGRYYVPEVAHQSPAQVVGLLDEAMGSQVPRDILNIIDGLSYEYERRVHRIQSGINALQANPQPQLPLGADFIHEWVGPDRQDRCARPADIRQRLQRHVAKMPHGDRFSRNQNKYKTAMKVSGAVLVLCALYWIAKKCGFIGKKEKPSEDAPTPDASSTVPESASDCPCLESAS